MVDRVDCPICAAMLREDVLEAHLEWHKHLLEYTPEQEALREYARLVLPGLRQQAKEEKEHLRELRGE